MKAKPLDLQRVVAKQPQADCRCKNPDWNHADNVAYKEAVNNQAEKFKLKIPVKIDMIKITACKLGEDETVDDYLHRLTKAFDTHSGIKHPNDLVVPLWWESYVINHFVRGFSPDIAAGVCKTCTGVDEGPTLEEVRGRAIHAQTQSHKKKKCRDEESERELHLAAATLLNTELVGKDYGSWRGRGRGA
ncbi:hypothetical protein Q8A73_007648 [Channa argus]|nr:hypothetical protein Q8A73_007648 [Channa argus]